jgi:hypothetical protein
MRRRRNSKWLREVLRLLAGEMKEKQEVPYYSALDTSNRWSTSVKREPAKRARRLISSGFRNSCRKRARAIAGGACGLGGSQRGKAKNWRSKWPSPRRYKGTDTGFAITMGRRCLSPRVGLSLDWGRGVAAVSSPRVCSTFEGEAQTLCSLRALLTLARLP